MIGNTWDEILEDVFSSVEFSSFLTEIKEDYEKFILYPKFENIFRAFQLTDYKDVKVVILGQDPYHQKGQANGLAFAVNPGVKTPPSLRNIFKEIERDLTIKNTDTSLVSWAKQGVLLLNTQLTVRDSQANFYANSYWKNFTDIVVRKVSEKKNVVFLLWGNNAKEKEAIISEGNYILTSTHPSPLSAHRGFLGCGHFSEANRILKMINKEEIDWRTYED